MDRLLDDVLALVVCTFLVPIDIFNLGNTTSHVRKVTRPALSRILIARTRALLPRMASPWPRVRLSGSTCWHALAGGDWKPNDVDFYCQLDAVPRAVDWITDAGYFFTVGGFAARAPRGPDGTYPGGNIHAVLNFRQWQPLDQRVPAPRERALALTRLDGRDRDALLMPSTGICTGPDRHRVQLIVLCGDGTLQFDMPVLENAFDGRVFHVAHPGGVATRTCDMAYPATCSTDRETDWYVQTHRAECKRRARLYEQRGLAVRCVAGTCATCGASVPPGEAHNSLVRAWKQRKI